MLVERRWCDTEALCDFLAGALTGPVEVAREVGRLEGGPLFLGQFVLEDGRRAGLAALAPFGRPLGEVGHVVALGSDEFDHLARVATAREFDDEAELPIIDRR